MCLDKGIRPCRGHNPRMHNITLRLNTDLWLGIVTLGFNISLRLNVSLRLDTSSPGTIYAFKACQVVKGAGGVEVEKADKHLGGGGGGYECEKEPSEQSPSLYLMR